MAKNTLPTNYVDDIMNVSANGNRKYRMIYNDDGTVSFEDVTPYEQVGSDYSAIDINTTNEAVNESFDKNKIVPDLTTINALTEQGYVPDALAVKRLNESLVNNEAVYIVSARDAITVYDGDVYCNKATKQVSGIRRFKATDIISFPVKIRDSKFFPVQNTIGYLIDTTSFGVFTLNINTDGLIGNSNFTTVADHVYLLFINYIAN